MVMRILAKKGNGHANRCWACSNEERRLCLRLLDAREGLSRGYAYGRIEDARYARNFEIRSHKKGYSDHMIACNTVGDFVRLTI
jgi:hypothetical protein